MVYDLGRERRKMTKTQQRLAIGLKTSWIFCHLNGSFQHVRPSGQGGYHKVGSVQERTVRALAKHCDLTYFFCKSKRYGIPMTVITYTGNQELVAKHFDIKEARPCVSGNE